MAFACSGDEVILALVSLVRAVDPRLLRQGPEGISVDLGPLERKASLSADERLLVMLQGVLDGAADARVYALELGAAEAQRLAETLAALEKVQPWGADVMEMSRGLRRRMEEVGK